MVWYTPVYFDLETTGLGKNSEIIQIAAISGDDEATFNQCIMPSVNIPHSVTRVNGFSVENGKLVRDGDIVKTTSPKDAAKKFIRWLDDCHNAPLMIAHNCGRFDAPRLYSLFEDFDIHLCFDDMGGEFADTLPFFQSEFTELPKHNLDYLVRHFVDDEGQDHDALQDAIHLKDVCAAARPRFSVKKLKDHYTCFRACEHSESEKEPKETAKQPPKTPKQPKKTKQPKKNKTLHSEPEGAGYWSGSDTSYDTAYALATCYADEYYNSDNS